MRRVRRIGRILSRNFEPDENWPRLGTRIHNYLVSPGLSDAQRTEEKREWLVPAGQNARLKMDVKEVPPKAPRAGESVRSNESGHGKDEQSEFADLASRGETKARRLPPEGDQNLPRMRRSSRARPMQKGRFLMGLIFSAAGISLMLAIAVGALQNAGINGRLSLPAVGMCMIVGLVLLGGGFGVMATSAPTFDDEEFDRLVADGQRSPDSSLQESAVSPKSEPPQDRASSDLPAA